MATAYRMESSDSDMVAIVDSDYTAINYQRQQADHRVESGQNHRDVDDRDDHPPTGDGCRQKCLGGRCWLLTFLCVAAVGQSMSVNGLIGVTISTIERRFALSSSQAAWITSAYEIAGIPALLVVGYVGSKIRRPLWIAGGLVVLSFGIVVYVLPHFVSPLYAYDASTNRTGSLCLPDGASSGQHPSICLAGEVAAAGSEKDKYLSMFVISSMLMGVGSVPLFVLGVTFIDDFAPHGRASFYLGVFYSMSVIGPVLAFVGGGYFLNIYDDFNRVDAATVGISQTDPLWVGAWWLGFLVSLVLVVLTIVPITCFPSNPPSSASVDMDDIADEHAMASARDLELDLSKTLWRDVLRTLWSLITNWTFLFTALYGTCDAMLIDGFQTFGAKYLQQQFALTSSMAGIVFGVVAIPGGVGGFLVGSYVIKRYSMSVRLLLRLNFILALICLGSLFAFAIQCDTSSFVGVTDVEQHQRYGNFNALCNVNCGCADDWFNPVCGTNNLSYFSACHAGCQHGSPDLGFSDCSCLAENASMVFSNVSHVEASQGVCSSATCQFWKFVLFVILFFVAMFIVFVCGMFHLSIILRVVPRSQRPLSYAVDWMLQRLLGAMPGPVLFGYVLDRSCLLWENKCGTSGACLYYDNHQMAWLMLVVCASCKTLSAVLGLVAWRLHQSWRNQPTIASVAETRTPLGMDRNHRLSILDQFHSSVLSSASMADLAVFDESELNASDAGHNNNVAVA